MIARKTLIALAGSGIVALLGAACGGSDATATPAPTATRPPAPTFAPTPTTAATPIPPTATRSAPTAAPPTPVPTLAPVPTATSGGAKRGGILQLRGIQPLVSGDTFDSRGRADFYLVASVLNNLIWTDPYAGGNTLSGDLVERWEVGDNGTALTFFLRRGVRYHDGTPLTSKDIAYNLDRGWKPRNGTMTIFRNLFAPIQSISTPDDLTVKVTLSSASNSFAASLATVGVLMYPAGVPFPEKADQWKQSLIGTGPFKLKSTDTAKLELVRNEGYWRPGLPNVDGIVFTFMGSNDIAVPALRTGRTDLESYVGTAVDILFNEFGASKSPYVFFTTNFSINSLHINQRPPWTDPKVREALSLALDRQAIVDIWLRGRGGAFPAPLLSPERGGQWGIPAEQMKTRPGFRPDKTADLARAKALLAEAGVDPSKVTVNIVQVGLNVQFGEVAERSVASLGFKTKLDSLAGLDRTERSLRGDFDILDSLAVFQFDDPNDYLGAEVRTGGALNFGKWSDPQLDALFAEQDKTLDMAKRKQLLLQLQDLVLTDRYYIPGINRDGTGVYMEWVKNYPAKLPYWWSPRYRYESVWLDR